MSKANDPIKIRVSKKPTPPHFDVAFSQGKQKVHIPCETKEIAMSEAKKKLATFDKGKAVIVDMTGNQ